MLPKRLMFSSYRTGWPLAVLGAIMAWSGAANADTATLNSGDTAWMLTSSVLVLAMTIPGLFLFYGGLARSKNVLSVLMHCFSLTAIVSVLWVLYGYSLAFDDTGMKEGELNLHSFIGGLSHIGLRDLTAAAVHGTIPESVWIMFQMTFAIITPSLIVGAFAERMKFSAMLWFSVLWVTLVYFPVAHMVWGGSGAFMGSDWGVIDFAGGTVVHINSGIAGLVACIMLGRRKGYPTQHLAPHNLTYSVIGGSLLWLGWFGFNAGSAAAADGNAGMAMLVTQVATAAAALAWMFLEWFRAGKPSVLGAVTGAVAGLVAVTPAAGTCGPLGALLLGAITSVVCFFTSTTVKHFFGYDDAFDVFGVHGTGGIVGSILTAVFAAPLFGGNGNGAVDYAMGVQLWAQVKGVIFTVLYSGIISYIILRVLKSTLGLRVSEETEATGLDLAEHSERGYNL